MRIYLDDKPFVMSTWLENRYRLTLCLNSPDKHEFRIVAESDKAYGIDDGSGLTVWLPKSHLKQVRNVE